MLLRDIVEKPSEPPSEPKVPPPPRPSAHGVDGFPAARHRSLRPDAGRHPLVRFAEPANPPPSLSADTSSQSHSQDADANIAETSRSASARHTTRTTRTTRTPREEAQEVLSSVDAENRLRVENMSGAEREEEVSELEARFGEGVLGALRKRAETRAKVKPPDAEAKKSSTHIAGTRPSAIVTSHHHQSTRNTRVNDVSPSQLKAAYFPDVPAEPRKLAWLQPVSSRSTDTSPRFDLAGRELSRAAQNNLPTDVGLHHHGDSPDLAGYTIDDVLYLCRSTVPGQRITMLGVLARIIGAYLGSPKAGSEGVLSEAAKEQCERQKLVQGGADLAVDGLLSGSKHLGLVSACVDLLYKALGGSSWTWIYTGTFADDVANSDRPFASPIPASLSDIPLEDLVPKLSLIISMGDATPPRTAHQIIAISRLATRISQELGEAFCPIVPIIMRQYLTHSPGNRSLCLDTLRAMNDAVTCSRSCAESILDSKVLPRLAQCILPVTWSPENSPATISLCEQAIAALHVLYSLGRYGLSSSVAKDLQEVWYKLGQWLVGRYNVEHETSLVRITTAYFDCLRIWTVCAIDPHRTTPGHDLTWSEVAAMAWVDEAQLALNQSLQKDTPTSLLTSLLEYLVAWLDGAAINGARNGASEREAVLNHLKNHRCDKRLNKILREVHVEEHPALWASAVRLQIHLVSDGKAELLDLEILKRAATDDRTDKRMMYSAVDGSCSFDLLKMARSHEWLEARVWLSRALALLRRYGPGSEPVGLDLLDDILRTDWVAAFPERADQLTSLSHKDGMQILRPLLQYQILPNASHILGPESPTHLYLKATTTLLPPARRTPGTEKKGMPGLPLPSDWSFGPLDELLRSATSIAFAQAPHDWDAGEPDIVRATLLLAEVQLDSHPASFPRSTILLDLMKVFMLEQDQQNATTSETDLFRDPTIAQSLKALIRPTTKPFTPPMTQVAPLESASLPFLGPETPFYQFYADFLTLYEAISFSDTVFGQLLVPPLAMTYPVDYRKLLWVDHPSALRSIRIRADQVPLEAGSHMVFFEPRETDSDVLAGYTRALTRGWVNESTEFLLRVAVYHLAALFWHGQEEGMDSVRVTLMRAIFGDAPDRVVRAIVEVDLGHGREERVVGNGEPSRRQELVRKLVGEQLVRRIPLPSIS